MLSHEEIPGTVVVKNFGNPGSVVAQGPRFPGGVEVVFQLPSMGEARIFTGTALSSKQYVHFKYIILSPPYISICEIL